MCRRVPHGTRLADPTPHAAPRRSTPGGAPARFNYRASLTGVTRPLGGRRHVYTWCRRTHELSCIGWRGVRRTFWGAPGRRVAPGAHPPVQVAATVDAPSDGRHTAAHTIHHSLDTRHLDADGPSGEVYLSTSQNRPARRRNRCQNRSAAKTVPRPFRLI